MESEKLTFVPASQHSLMRCPWLDLSRELKMPTLVHIPQIRGIEGPIDAEQGEWVVRLLMGMNTQTVIFRDEQSAKDLIKYIFDNS